MTYKITIDEETCIGCAACTIHCDNYEMDNAKAKVKQAEVKEIGCNQEAADSCPVDAIIIKKQ